MEPETLRLILAILAVVTIFSIYAWERIRRRARDESEVSHGFGSDVPDALVTEENEAEMSSASFSAKKKRKMVLPSLSAAKKLKKVTPKLTAKKATTQQVGKQSALAKAIGLSARRKSGAAEDSDEDELKMAPIETPEPAKEKIISLSVVANQGQTFDGEKILDAVNSEELEYGNMKIFHRLKGEEENQIIFSMVNMVEPGYFDIKDMASTETPGVTFFMRLPGSEDSLSMFTDMLCTAERMASKLDGQILNEKHDLLDKDVLLNMRDEIARFDHAAGMH